MLFAGGPESVGVLYALFSLATFLPSIAVTVRRLHDRNQTGWWWWLWLVPVIGWIVLIVWYCIKGTEGDNAYGHDPLGGAATRPSSIPEVPR